MVQNTQIHQPKMDIVVPKIIVTAYSAVSLLLVSLFSIIVQRIDMV